jgi:hypothetical protein
MIVSVQARLGRTGPIVALKIPILFAVLSVGAAAAAETDDSIAQAFASSIELFSSRDPESPDTLNSRLAFADFLAKTGGGECLAQLNSAQQQLDLATATPALSLIVPLGPAHAAGVDYQIHLGRASCDANAETRERELRAALESAKRAADLYREGFDAVAMATMQFNVAVTHHSLGDSGAALSALQATLDIDHEYGFDDDAEENYQLLLQWSGQPDGPEAVDARMQDFPERSATMAFAWSEYDAALTLHTDIAVLVDGELTRIDSARSARRQVRKGFDSWVVSYQSEPQNGGDPGDTHIDLDRLSAKEAAVQATANSLARVLTSLHDFAVARNGDYDESRGGFKFGARVRTESKRLKGEIASMSAGATPLLRRLGPAIRAALLPDALEPQVAENYNLETGTWIGAALEQGVWYPMTAALSLPLAPQVFIAHKIEFAYSRPVPCLPDSAADSCVEILLRAAPDPEVVKPILEKLARSARLPRTQIPQLWSVTEMRLIADPQTLQPYRRETRRHAYWWSGTHGPNESLIESTTTIESLSPLEPKPAPR